MYFCLTISVLFEIDRFKPPLSDEDDAKDSLGKTVSDSSDRTALRLHKLTACDIGAAEEDKESSSLTAFTDIAFFQIFW